MLQPLLRESCEKLRASARRPSSRDNARLESGSGLRPGGPRRVAGAANVRLDVGDPIEHIRKLGGKIPNARPSMLLDHNAGRRDEVEAINGSTPRLGKRYGIPTPINETVAAIIKARESGFTA